MVNQLNPTDDIPQSGLEVLTGNVYGILKNLNKVRDDRMRLTLRLQLKARLCRIIDEYPDEYTPDIIL